MPAINWKEKAAALLHDPVFKAFDIKSHENLANELCSIAGVPSIRGQEDIVGSSLERSAMNFGQEGMMWDATKYAA